VLTRLRSRRGQPRYHFVAFAVVLGAAGALAAAGSGLEDTRQPGAAERAPGARPDARAGATLRIAWAASPGSLDPALATDHTALNVVAALGDPLVELGPDLEPEPALALRWEVSPDGRRMTFHLRADGRWSNGASVTAGDFAYSWRRVLDPALESPHAPLLFGIRGAKAYNRCVGADCRRLVREVGVEAPDDRTLVVTLAAPRPWFLAEVAHPAFLPVHRPTVERHGRRWAGPRRIVTSGPFTLAELGRESFTLVRSRSWRGAEGVALERVEGRIIPDGNARVLAFDGGQVEALDGAGLPGTELPRSPPTCTRSTSRASPTCTSGGRWRSPSTVWRSPRTCSSARSFRRRRSSRPPRGSATGPSPRGGFRPRATSSGRGPSSSRHGASSAS
jgi:oligopeptide transport system substrate-binding protein